MAYAAYFFYLLKIVDKIFCISTVLSQWFELDKKYIYWYVQMVLQLASYFSEMVDAWITEGNLLAEKRGTNIYSQNMETIHHWDMSYGWRVQMSSAAAKNIQNAVLQPDQYHLIYF